MELRGLQKLDNNLVRALFIYLYCIFFTVCNLPFTALYFTVNGFFLGGGGLTLDNTCSKDAITYVFYFFAFVFIFLQENLLNKIVLKQNKSNLAIRLCLPNDVMKTVMTSVTGSHYK